MLSKKAKKWSAYLNHPLFASAQITHTFIDITLSLSMHFSHSRVLQSSHPFESIEKIQWTGAFRSNFFVVRISGSKSSTRPLAGRCPLAHYGWQGEIWLCSFRGYLLALLYRKVSAVKVGARQIFQLQILEILLAWGHPIHFGTWSLFHGRHIPSKSPSLVRPSDILLARTCTRSCRRSLADCFVARRRA